MKFDNNPLKEDLHEQLQRDMFLASKIIANKKHRTAKSFFVLEINPFQVFDYVTEE